jgi:GAF domain-containing protein
MTYLELIMDESLTSTKKPLVVDNWPMNLEATRKELNKAKKRLEQYRAALRLAGAEIERRNRSIIALTNFAYQTGRITNPVALFKLALTQGMNTLDAPAGAIILIDPNSKELALSVHKGLTTELTQVLTGQQLGTGATALMPHLAAGEGALLEYETENKAERLLLAAGRLDSLVSLPLQFGATLFGAVLVGLADSRSFTPAELCFLMALTQETALALETLRLRDDYWQTVESLLGGKTEGIELHPLDEAELNLDTAPPLDLPLVQAPIPQPAQDDLEQLLAAMMEAEDEVQKQNADLQTLNLITEQMNRNLNLKQILQCAVDHTRTTLQADAAWLYLVNAGGELELRAYAGLSETYVRGMSRLQPGEGLEGRTMAEKKICFVEHVAQDPNPYKIWVDKEGLQALAAVPLSRPREEAGAPIIIGVLAAGRRQRVGQTWSPRQARLLTSIAYQVALTVDNARLYARLQESEHQLRAGNEVLQSINDMLLERNAELYNFIQDDLDSALTTASLIFSQLRLEHVPAPHKKELANIHQTLRELSTRTRKILSR